MTQGFRVWSRQAKLSAALAVMAFTAFAIVTGPAHSQTSYPAKPVRIIVPYAAGGGVDIIGRGIAEGLTKQGHTVTVENRAGAGSNVGSTFVAKSDPDGYTLLIGSNANAVNGSLYSNMQYDPARELTPIVWIGRAPMVMLASPAIPFKNVRDVVDQAKAKPGSLNFGSGGSGTSEHLTYELFKRRAGIEATHVPYKGGAAVYPDLMSGRVQFMFNNQIQAMPFIQAGQVRAIGIASTKRSARLPDVPTLIEQGVPDFNASAWWGLMGPGGMPPALVAQINQMANAVIDSPDFAKRIDGLGAERVGGTPEQFRDFFKAEMGVWSGIIKAENIKVE